MPIIYLPLSLPPQGGWAAHTPRDTVKDITREGEERHEEGMQRQKMEVQKVRGIDRCMCESLRLTSLSRRNRNVAAGTSLPWMMTLVFHAVALTFFFSHFTFSSHASFPSLAESIPTNQISGGITRGKWKWKWHSTIKLIYISATTGEKLGFNMLIFSIRKNILFFTILPWYCLSKPFKFWKKPVFHVKGVMSPEHQQNYYYKANSCWEWVEFKCLVRTENRKL